MTDGIISGTGNSRFLRTVANILTYAPTWADAAALMAAGEFPIDLNGINPDGWDTLGTLLNKANLLSDETAAGLGLGAEATVNQALEKIKPAKDTADTAASTANTALSTANSAYNLASGKAVFVAGTYIGDNAATRTINLSFTPNAVFVLGRGIYLQEGGNDAATAGGLAVTGYATSANAVRVVSGGFSVGLSSGSGLRAFTNSQGELYHYIAFK